MAEYTCARCGLLVVWITPQPPESLYCLTCRFIEGIEDPSVKQAFIDRLKLETKTKE